MIFFRFLILLASAAAAGAAPLQDMQFLYQKGNNWLEQQAVQTWPGVRAQGQISPADERLRLPSCQDLLFFLPAGGHLGHGGSLGVQCRSPAKWSLYLSYRLRLSGPALVARRPLPARTALAGTDLETRVIEYQLTPPAYVSDARLLAGSQLNRPVLAEQALLVEWLVRRTSIHAGQRVRIEVRGVGFNVNQEGQALDSAAAGETLRAKTSSGRVVRGVAQEDGSLLVRP